MPRKRLPEPPDGEKLEKEHMPELDAKEAARLAAIAKADAEDDEDEDEDMDKGVMDEEAPDDDEDEDDDEEDDGGKTQKSASDSDRATLAKAIRVLTRHGELNDPSLRKEALLAKELRGGGLTKSQKSELAGMLMGVDASRLTVADEVRNQQAPGPALAKSMVSNSAMSEGYDNVTKSLALQAEHMDHVTKALQESNYLIARTMTAIGDTVGDIYDRQEQLGSALESFGAQPVHEPRSAGLGYTEKSFGGNGHTVGSVPGSSLAKARPAQIARALDELAKSNSQNASQREAYKLAALGLAMNKPLPPSIAAQVGQYLDSEA